MLPRISTSAVLPERLGSKEPLKSDARQGPWSLRATRGCPSCARRQLAGQRERRACCSRRGEESNLKTLSHNYGKLFTFMLY